MENKIYLGDGAYAQWHGYGVELTAENGITATDTIFLELEHIEKLIQFIKAKKAEKVN